MPLVKNIITEAGVLGIWELSESVQELETIFSFSVKEMDDYCQINSEKRKTEYLSARLLTSILLGEKVEITYLESRKPMLKNNSSFISISHSNNLVAVLITPNHPVGIDAELINRNIDHVAKRFLSVDEATHIEKSANPQTEKILYWCAKESIFKCTPNQGIQFNSQIAIEPFLLKDKGLFFGRLILEHSIEAYKLWYFTYKNNMIVYCVLLNDK